MKTLVQEITEIIELEYYNQMTAEQAVNLILQAISKRDKECLKNVKLIKTEGYGFIPVYYVGKVNKYYPRHQRRFAELEWLNDEFGYGFNKAIPIIRSRLAKSLEEI